MRKLLLLPILIGIFLFAENVVALSCYEDEGAFPNNAACQAHCIGYSHYFYDGATCYCVQNCELMGSCGYGTCQSDEFPQWSSCSEGEQNGECQYTCIYDEFCAGSGGDNDNNDNNNGGIFRLESPINATSFEALVDGITNFIFTIALAIVPLMILIGGFYLVTAGGDPKRIERGRAIILYTLIGFAIVLLAKGLVSVLKSILGA